MVPFSLDINSAASLASPFYNNAGITFGNAEGINTAGDVGATASSNKAPTRQEAGGLNPFPSTTPVGFLGGGDNGGMLPYIIGGIVIVLGLVYFAFKK